MTATFRTEGIKQPNNTLIAPFSDGHTEAFQATFDHQIAAGPHYTFNKAYSLSEMDNV